MWRPGGYRVRQLARYVAGGAERGGALRVRPQTLFSAVVRKAAREQQRSKECE